MWFKHRAWIPAAWLLSIGNIVAVWFAAMPAETWHATTHAILAVLLGAGAERLAARQKALSRGDDYSAAALRGADSETLQRVERAVDAIAIELERVGEGQRFLTRTLTESPLALERPPQPEPNPLFGDRPLEENEK